MPQNNEDDDEPPPLIDASDDEDNGDDSQELPRRSSRTSRMPERFNDYIIAKCGVPRTAPPRTYEEAMAREDSVKWENALANEIETLEKHGGMTVVPHPRKGEEVVPIRTIFEEKLDNITGEVKEKARCVARGDKTKLKKQKKSKTVDLKQIYSPVVSMIVVRILIALAAALNLFVRQNDIKRAFLNSRRNKITYLHLPKGHPRKDGTKYVWQSHGMSVGCTKVLVRHNLWIYD